MLFEAFHMLVEMDELELSSVMGIPEVKKS
jgi:hypothetical protein